MHGTEPTGTVDDYRYGVDLFNAGYWWEAHVYFERLWMDATSENERQLLQGLIQLAAALVKRRQGQRRGEAKLRAKALDKLSAVRARTSAPVLGLSVHDLLRESEDGGVPILRLG